MRGPIRLPCSAWFGFCPFDGGRLELSGVFDGSPSLASSAITRAVRLCTCAHSARIKSRPFSASLRRLSSGSWVTSRFRIDSVVTVSNVFYASQSVGKLPLKPGSSRYVWIDLLALGWEGEMKGSVAKFGLEHILQQYPSRNSMLYYCSVTAEKRLLQQNLLSCCGAGRDTSMRVPIRPPEPSRNHDQCADVDDQRNDEGDRSVAHHPLQPNSGHGDDGHRPERLQHI